MTTSDSPSASAFTSAERDYIRRELDQFFSTFPYVAEGLSVKDLARRPAEGPTQRCRHLPILSLAAGSYAH